MLCAGQVRLSSLPPCLHQGPNRLCDTLEWRRSKRSNVGTARKCPCNLLAHNSTCHLSDQKTICWQVSHPSSSSKAFKSAFNARVFANFLDNTCLILVLNYAYLKYRRSFKDILLLYRLKIKLQTNQKLTLHFASEKSRLACYWSILREQGHSSPLDQYIVH